MNFNGKKDSPNWKNPIVYFMLAAACFLGGCFFLFRKSGVAGVFFSVALILFGIGMAVRRMNGEEQRQKQMYERLRQAGIFDLKRLSTDHFSYYVCKLLRECGWKPITENVPDGMKEGTLFEDGKRIQLLFRDTADSVTEQEVRMLTAELSLSQASELWIAVPDGPFPEKIYRLSKKLPVRVMDGGVIALFSIEAERRKGAAVPWQCGASSRAGGGNVGIGIPDGVFSGVQPGYSGERLPNAGCDPTAIEAAPGRETVMVGIAANAENPATEDSQVAQAEPSVRVPEAPGEETLSVADDCCTLTLDGRNVRLTFLEGRNTEIPIERIGGVLLQEPGSFLRGRLQLLNLTGAYREGNGFAEYEACVAIERNQYETAAAIKARLEESIALRENRKTHER